jgi:hypothetical protein
MIGGQEQKRSGQESKAAKYKLRQRKQDLSTDEREIREWE